MRRLRGRVHLFAIVPLLLLALSIPLLVAAGAPVPLPTTSSPDSPPPASAIPSGADASAADPSEASAAAGPMGGGSSPVASGTVPAPTTSTTAVLPPTTTSELPPIRDLEADVVVYGTTSAGVGAVRSLERFAERSGRPLTVAIVSGLRHMESPLAQGLGVEDAYHAGAYLSGFYEEFRWRVIRWYERQGRKAHVPQGRLHYEPEAGTAALEGFLDRPGVTWHTGIPVEAEEADEAGDRFVLLRRADGGYAKIHTRYFIDASPEGDLGRLLGADYMVGRLEDVFNDKDGRRPPPPDRTNDWKTAPQAFSMLLTLQLREGGAQPIRGFDDYAPYDPGSYGEIYRLPAEILTGFSRSWSVEHALPNGRLELNEAWSDYTMPTASFEWVFDPDSRDRLRVDMANWTINRVRFLQENGYPTVGISSVPEHPYIREGVRFYGERVYRGEDIDRERAQDVVAVGAYARYDRHDAFFGTAQDPTAATVFVPMGALMPKGQPYLLTPTAISSDENAYCSAVRSEPVRANMGAAAGIMVGLADAAGSDLHSVPYAAVRAELERQGHRLD